MSKAYLRITIYSDGSSIYRLVDSPISIEEASTYHGTVNGILRNARVWAYNRGYSSQGSPNCRDYGNVVVYQYKVW